jgi:hypothetical protein
MRSAIPLLVFVACGGRWDREEPVKADFEVCTMTSPCEGAEPAPDDRTCPSGRSLVRCFWFDPANEKSFMQPSPFTCVDTAALRSAVEECVDTQPGCVSETFDPPGFTEVRCGEGVR